MSLKSLIAGLREHADELEQMANANWAEGLGRAMTVQEAVAQLRTTGSYFTLSFEVSCHSHSSSIPEVTWKLYSQATSPSKTWESQTLEGVIKMFLDHISEPASVGTVDAALADPVPL